VVEIFLEESHCYVVIFGAVVVEFSTGRSEGEEGDRIEEIDDHEFDLI
jgi:hypothetical protein